MFDNFYGFTARPFQLTPDPAFYFESLTHRKALSYLGYGLAQGEGFVVITGEVGAGKSTLVAHLMATIDPARMTAANIVTSALDGEEIVHVVAQAFGLQVSGHDKAAALGAIEAFLHAEARAGRRSLLIVDEAQNLSISALEELRMLSNFQLGAHPLLQTLLLGQPEFRDTLAHSEQLEQLRQRVIATHHLAAMATEEVQAYVEHRLNCASWSGNPSIDAELFGEIHRASAGIPRRINQIVNRLLLLGAVEQKSQLDRSTLQQVLLELETDGVGQREIAKSDEATVPPAVNAASDEAVAVHTAPARSHDHGLETAEVIALIEAALAGRDARLDAVQQAMLDFAEAVDKREAQPAADSEAVMALRQQLDEAGAHAARLEARLAEQERTLRHTLTMLIEWMESGETPRVAA
jgi:putative secretion ATPase, PEP-CTERM locus subfamily